MDKSSMSAVFYATVQQSESDGIFLDFPFFGGIIESEKVTELARNITDDKLISGTVITKVYTNADSQPLEDIRRMAHRQFCQMATQMYDMEEMQQRKEKKRALSHK